MKRTIDFMGARRVVLGITLSLLLVSLVSLLFRGLNYGLDFTGGALVELSYAKPVPLETLRDQLRDAGFEGAVVQSFGSTTDVVVRMPSDDPKASQQLVSALKGASPDNVPRINRTDFVGPAVGEDLRDQGGLGLLLALGGILVYVAFRFQWKFGCGAVLSLFHDVILVLGVFSVFAIPFDLTVLAAVLAVIGYSLNDTIVVFDRVRENFRLLRRAGLVENLNISTTQTLLRTLATSISTLLAVVALMVWGGEHLWGFSLALFIGIVAGTTSSVYVANSTLVWLKLERTDLIPSPNGEVDNRP